MSDSRRLFKRLGIPEPRIPAEVTRADAARLRALREQRPVDEQQIKAVSGRALELLRRAEWLLAQTEDTQLSSQTFVAMAKEMARLADTAAGIEGFEEWLGNDGEQEDLVVFLRDAAVQCAMAAVVVDDREQKQRAARAEAAERRRAARAAARDQERRSLEALGQHPAERSRLCVRCGKRDKHFDDYCKRCANDLGVRPTGPVR